MSTHILLIDDDPVQRRLLRHAVERIGHTAHMAENGKQGLEALAEKIIPAGRVPQKVPTKTDVDAQNTESLAALEAMMGKVEGIRPKKRPRRV